MPEGHLRMSSLESQLRSNLDNYFNLQQKNNDQQAISTRKHVPYGTAGFRGNAREIEHVFYRVGLVSAIRCLQLKANIGIMVTASHNPIGDNGIKLIDAGGEMLASDWEPIVERFCNIEHKEELLQELLNLLKRYTESEYNQQVDHNQLHKGHVLIGFDTRPSSPTLVGLVQQGLAAWQSMVDYANFGQVTTPVLHYLVAKSNMQQDAIEVQDYYDQLVTGMIDLFDGEGDLSTDTSKLYLPAQLVIDCANGVGFKTMQNLLANKQFSQLFPIRLINVGEGTLNHLCGADYVKTRKLPPLGADETGKRYASLDGDADRVVYFYLTEPNNEEKTEEEEGKLRLNLLDGDKIMALYAHYLKESLTRAGLVGQLSLGVVQTAYANGASTDFIQNKLGIPVDCVETGVKNLHKQAVHYDVGIYFEANGHGTIWFSAKAIKMIGEASDSVELGKVLKIINNYTGDAISDILVVETILRHYNWDVDRWFQLYEDRPNALIKIEISNRNCIETTNASRTCVKPAGLQAAIDSLVAECGVDARAFVRPSGTENVVRIYAEASQREAANRLADRVGQKVLELCK